MSHHTQFTHCQLLTSAAADATVVIGDITVVVVVVADIADVVCQCSDETVMTRLYHVYLR